ncbi:MAG TPA: hypothetical protein VGM37_14645 [Armatimonadota bacterium]
MEFAYVAQKGCGCVVGAALIGSLEDKEMGVLTNKWVAAGFRINCVELALDANIALGTCEVHRRGLQPELFDDSGQATPQSEAKPEEPGLPILWVHPDSFGERSTGIIGQWANDEGPLCAQKVRYAVKEDPEVQAGYGLLPGDVAILLDPDGAKPEAAGGRICLQCRRTYDDRPSCIDCGQPTFWTLANHPAPADEVLSALDDDDERGEDGGESDD